MRIPESNCFPLGPGDFESIDLECSEITLMELLKVLSAFDGIARVFYQRGRGLASGWIVEMNENALGLYNMGLETVLKDGYREGHQT